jgi:hypothetical protein
MWVGIIIGWAVGMAVAFGIIIGFQVVNPVVAELIFGPLSVAGIGIGGLVANKIIYRRRY